MVKWRAEGMRIDLPSGTVTFLFTDIEGSTRLLHALGPEAYAEALGEHRRLLRAAFAEHAGAEVDTQGDAFFVAFPTAEGAAAAAQAAHAALATGPVRVRIGLHTGTPTLTAEGYVGADVHRGARIAALAHGGQTLVSPATAALLDGQALLDLGLHRLKDFDAAVRLHQLGHRRFPVLRSPGAVDLPVPATSFLGRERELFGAVATWLEREPRLLTVVGPGGTGKTRFAIELARLLADEAEGGTAFVPLAPLRDPVLVLPAVAERLGCPPDPRSLAARIGQRRTHVLLDNLEQLLPGAAGPLSELLAAAPELRLLATSREPLRIAGETELDLEPLRDDEAVALFLERARGVQSRLEPSAAVRELCARLDRLPLALELAAVQTKLLAVEQVLARLATALDSLRGTRDAEARHATLRATIAWSYDLLAEEERRLLVRLAVFRSGWTLETAETVCDASLDTLAALLDKSLIRRRAEPDGPVRLWMLETIREFARERLDEEPELAVHTRRRHAEWALGLARAARLSSEDRGLDEPHLELVAAERDEIRAALDWAESADPVLAVELVVALEQYWVTHLHEARPRLEALREAAGALPPALRARLLRATGGVAMLLGERERGERLYGEALELFRALGDERSAVALLARFAVHAGSDDPEEEARRRIAEVRALNAHVGNPAVEAQMTATEAELARRAGKLNEARELYRRSAEQATACSFPLWALWMRNALLDVELELGLVAEAERSGREALALATSLEDERLARSILTGLALAALERGDLERAGTLWGAVAAAEAEAPLLRLGHSFAGYAARLEACADGRFLAAAGAGGREPLARAVALALGEEPQTSP